MLRIVAGAGLLLTLAALLNPGAGAGSGPLAVRVMFTVPHRLAIASAVLFALAGLVLLVAARGRQKLEEPEPTGRLPWWGQAIAQIALMLPFLITVAVLWLDGGRIAGAVLNWGRGWLYTDGATSGASEGPVISLPWLGWTFGLLWLAVALVTLAVALLLLFGERLIGWWLARRARPATAEVVDAVDDSLDDLADELDTRIAIIRCYRRFEQAAARARVRRASWQTAEEFMRDACALLPVPDLAVERLTRLFEVARFSDHPVRSTDRDCARARLEEIRTALARRDESLVVA